MRHKHAGYANVKTITTLNHSHDSHARITPADLEENDKRLKEPCDSNETIETLIDQVEDALEYAAAGENPCTPRQIVKIACALVFNTGVYHDDCKIWRQKPEAEQTWEAFKVFFAKANQDLRAYRQTSRTAGYQANNTMVERQDSENDVQALEAIANLATESAEDKQTIGTLTATNASLVAELIELRKEFANFRKTSRNAYKHYCWSCGTYCNHDSKICKAKKPGHEDEATWKNKLGGNESRYKPKT